MMNLITSLFFASAIQLSLGSKLRGSDPQARNLQGYYYTSSDLGSVNKDVTVGNPLKGLLTSPRWTGFNTPDAVPSTMEFYYLGMDEVMTGWNQYDWSTLDETLSSAASRNKHVIWRIYCHYPNKPLRIPQFLLDAGIEMRGESPQYDNPTLLKAFQQLIYAMGERYDGHKSIGFIQLGLLGKWGEWHTYPESGLLSDQTKDTVVGWYADAFQTTQLQIRDPLRSAYDAGIGLHDDSFGYTTLDGAPNGGQIVDWFFWPKVKSRGVEQFWKRGAMGGETRPEIQEEIFEPWYNKGTSNKQDFDVCVDVTHATYMFHHNAFQGGGYSGSELDNALHSHSHMGYNFHVSNVAAAAASSGKVHVDITVKQVGVAPFYYPLSLELVCPGGLQTTEGVDDLVENGQSDTFSFVMPATTDCLDNLQVKLASYYAYESRPVKFAQNDGTVRFSVPVPDGAPTNPSTVSPTVSPTNSPTPSPIQPSTPSTSPPTNPPTLSPVDPSAPSPTDPVNNECGYADFRGQCSYTSGCQALYTGATDCRNDLGGVCYCDSDVCGCRGTPKNPTNPPTNAPTNPPASPPRPTNPLPPTVSTSTECFSGSMKVHVQGRGAISMRELVIGDIVRVDGTNQYSQVHGFYHKDETMEVDFVSISTNRSDYMEPLEITSNHLLFVNGVARPAGEVKVGDYLQDDILVTEISVVQRRGVYAPAVFSGTIRVNGVVASTYTSNLKHSPINEHTGIHVVLTYHRLLCRWNMDWCKAETYSEEGLSNMNLPLIQLARYLNTWGATVQIACSLVLLPLFGLVFVLEQLILYPAVLVALVLLGKWTYQQRRRTSPKQAS